MSENRLSLKSCCFPYVILLSVLTVLARSFSMGFSLFTGDLLTALSLVALSFGVDLYRAKNQRAGILLVIASAFLYFGGAEFLCSLNVEAPVGPNFLASIALSFPVLLVLPLLWKMGERKISLFLITLLGAVVFYGASRNYVYSYTYLYMDITDIVSHTKLFQLLVYGAIVVALLEFLVKSKRSALVYILLGASVLVSSYEALLRNSLGFSLKNCVAALTATWLPVTFLILLIIYIRGEAPEKRVYERRNVVFSNMVYQELKPIKKKKRAPKFEVPPNVPKAKRELEEDRN